MAQSNHRSLAVNKGSRRGGSEEDVNAHARLERCYVADFQSEGRRPRAREEGPSH